MWNFSHFYSLVCDIRAFYLSLHHAIKMKSAWLLQEKSSWFSDGSGIQHSSLLDHFRKQGRGRFPHSGRNRDPSHWSKGGRQCLRPEFQGISREVLSCVENSFLHEKSQTKWQYPQHPNILVRLVENHTWKTGSIIKGAYIQLGKKVEQAFSNGKALNKQQTNVYESVSRQSCHWHKWRTRQWQTHRRPSPHRRPLRPVLTSKKNATLLHEITLLIVI